jgi:hypothetical protein
MEGDPRDADITADEFMRFSDGFWYIPPESQRRGHPTPFPEELIYRLIKFYTYKGNVVLDMFGGTGTVAVVARKTGRHFIHIDISQRYCEIARQRLETARMLQELPISVGRTGKKAKVGELFSPRIGKCTHERGKREEIPGVQLLDGRKAYRCKEANDT